tara:strand:+ start:270 stop:563 length:294 start_codon:yes stop_codon:yes gene_type:complete
MIELPPSFIHQPPEGHSYECTFKTRSLVSIWICNHQHFYYTDRSPVKCIWGFYNTKEGCYYSPINSTKQGNKVDIHKTTAYSAMIPNLNPLEMALYV